MARTVKQLATLSGVSVRTLHYYDEVGLLPPAYVGSNGYRYYEDEQLLRLQQILFYRELGFGLGDIQAFLDNPDFDKIRALESHRASLQADIARQRRLIATVDKTLHHLKTNTPMASEDYFAGFDPQEQERHEKALIDRCGDDMKTSIAASKARVKHWTKPKWTKTMQDFAAICQDFVTLMERGLSADSSESLAVAGRHFAWLSQFWTPNRTTYKGHAQFILDSELRNAYTSHHCNLPEYAALAIEAYADSHLDDAPPDA